MLQTHQTPAKRGSRGALLMGLVMAITTLLPHAQADLFELRSGGQLRGVWLNRKDPNRKNYVVRTEFGGEVVLSKSQVARIVPQSTTDYEYENLRPTLPDTVEGHSKLAEWCKENGLTRQRKSHLQRILEIDPDHEPTRISLGYRKVSKRWMTREEEMASRGMIRYKGDYKTSQEIEILEREEKQRKAEKAWYVKLKTWRGWLNRPNRQQQGRANIISISSPRAVKAIAEYQKNEPNPHVRLLYLEALANINTGSSISILIAKSLSDPEEEVRMTALDYVVRSEHKGVVREYTAALHSKSNRRVNRAAIALRELGNEEAIAPLIDALVTTHTHKTKGTDPGRMSTSFGKGGGGLTAGGTPSVTIRKRLPNSEVLAALIEMTKVNYEYDQSAWKAWYSQHVRSNQLNARRD